MAQQQRRSKQAASSPRSPKRAPAKRAPAKRAARAPATSPSPQQPPPLKPGEWRIRESLPGDPFHPTVIERWPDGLPKVVEVMVGVMRFRYQTGRVRIPPGKTVSILTADTQPHLAHPESQSFPEADALDFPDQGVRIVRPTPQVGRAAAVGARRGHASQRADALDEARRLLAIVDGPEYRTLRPKTLWGKVRALPEFEGRWKSGDSVRRAIDRARKMVAKADPDNG